ncbi:MAG: VWA domain-containing protein [Leptospiraceae bacterium]|nr:VWA domain-containing protein [Leptospiraceae bacterium]
MRIYHLAIVFLLLATSLLPREVSFLPTYIIGNPPDSIRSKDAHINEAFSDLIAFYAQENFQVDVSDSDKMRNYLASIDYTGEDKKPSRSLLNGVCSELEPDYVTKSEIDFSGTPVIQTDVYNCKGKLIYSEETILSGDFYVFMEKHAKKAFGFLSPKRKQDMKSNLSSNEEIVIAVDLSGSMSADTKQLAEYISSITGTEGLSLGLLTLSSKEVKFIKPDTNHTKIKDELARLRFGQDIDIDTLIGYLQKARKNFTEKTNRTRKFILFTDAKPDSTSGYKLGNTLKSYSSLGFAVHLVTGSYFDFKEMRIYKKALGMSGALHQIKHEQKIGTIQGFRTVYLYDRKIFYDKKGNENSSIKDLPQIPEGKVYGIVQFPHPGNFSDVYLQFSGDKPLEKGAIKSNIAHITEKIMFSSGKSLDGFARKVLVKAGPNSIWIYSNEVDAEMVGEEIAFRTVFKKDLSTSLGFSNIPNETKIQKDSIPSLLNLTQAEIKAALSKGDKDFLSCFVKGRILEVK